MGLRVKARAISDEQKYSGYYAHLRRRPGEEFEIETEEQFSYFWMEAVGWEPKPVSPETVVKRQEEYARKLSMIANGADVGALLRADDARFARERDALRGAEGGVRLNRPVQRGL